MDEKNRAIMFGRSFVVRCRLVHGRQYGRSGFLDGEYRSVVKRQKIQFPDAKPYQDAQGSVMVPIRFVSEALGAEVGWQKVNGQMTVSVNNEKHNVRMTVGQKVAKVDGQDKSYGTKIELKQNRTFVPLRLVSEGLGQPVEWDKIGRWVWIGEKKAPTLEELGLKPVSIEPYRKWFEKKPYLLKSPREDFTYEKVLIFKFTDLPTSLLRDIYSIEPYTDAKTKVTYLKVRSKTTSTAGNLFYLTKKQDIRYRYPIDQRTINNGDGTKYSFYPIFPDQIRP
ncbi:copper amine oxidase N-terminal domain-containing protein [Paenibacillus sp. JTLBN-2024]